MTGREEGRTLYLLPDEAGRLIKAAATHIKPLLIFMLGSGARMSEAMELDWREVKLGAAKVQFLKTKQRKRRVAHMPPAVVAALAKLSHREGPVFRRPDGRPYIDRERRYGGQIKTAWCGAARRPRFRAAPA
jgi:integrase